MNMQTLQCFSGIDKKNGHWMKFHFSSRSTSPPPPPLHLSGFRRSWPAKHETDPVLGQRIAATWQHWKPQQAELVAEEPVEIWKLLFLLNKSSFVILVSTKPKITPRCSLSYLWMQDRSSASVSLRKEPVASVFPWQWSRRSIGSESTAVGGWWCVYVGVGGGGLQLDPAGCHVIRYFITAASLCLVLTWWTIPRTRLFIIF